MEASNYWPKLPSPDEWADTLNTVHMWTQVIGKIRLELNPWINHSWGSTLYVSARGLSTHAIPFQNNQLEIEFNFLEHKMEFYTSDGKSANFDLKPLSVASFYEKTMSALNDLNIDVKIFTRPVEVEEAILFEEDRKHKSYDREFVTLFWKALVQINRVFEQFRARFTGKSSPSHFFWGAFDLAVTRFSGRAAPKHPGGAPNCADWVMEEAYSRELSSAGFWPGQGLGEPAFYSYSYPAPDGFTSAGVQPDEAYYHDDLGEFILPYKAVQSAKNPDALLLEFLQSTYEAAADHGNWDRTMLEERHPKLS
ncbi:DUF5996 family protein [Rhodohalobacter mucosus]|uniref:Ava_C0101 and related proteins n=1 Tax=Rhodohalobacter mucosus TaxID=2079485 RepID=A0A316TLT6_9BACT|nr:DUF5996 family protein [Rhodohalobacter mucosus]PWN05537.1 hypothetical protein DDZ15_13095 [Rhodohalobacter mucosus]